MITLELVRETLKVIMLALGRRPWSYLTKTYSSIIKIQRYKEPFSMKYRGLIAEGSRSRWSRELNPGTNHISE